MAAHVHGHTWVLRMPKHVCELVIWILQESKGNGGPEGSSVFFLFVLLVLNNFFIVTVLKNILLTHEK